MDEFIYLVLEMRKHQQEFQRNKSTKSAQHSRRLEQQVDEFINTYKITVMEKRQLKLFSEQ